MQPGETIEIKALHADRAAYRWWRAQVEAVNGPEIVVSWPIGTRFGAPQPSGEKISRLHYREYYWLDRHWNIAAGYNAAGEFERIYADITSLPWIDGKQLIYIDHELDVIRQRGQRAEIADEDEFAGAITTYGYTREFQQHCRAATEELRRIVDAWQPAERFEFRHSDKNDDDHDCRKNRARPTRTVADENASIGCYLPYDLCSRTDLFLRGRAVVVRAARRRLARSTPTGRTDQSGINVRNWISFSANYCTAQTDC